MNERWWAAVAICLALGLGLAGRWIDRPVAPARRDPSAAQAWMADALPGVGAKRIDPALESLRRGRFDDLPKQARDTARTVFTPP